MGNDEKAHRFDGSGGAGSTGNFIDIRRHAGRFDSAEATEINFIALIAHQHLIEYQKNSGKNSKAYKGETNMRKVVAEQYLEMISRYCSLQNS